jgi:nitrite reductase (NADH) large subunit
MRQLVVVGNGMAGVACVEQTLRHAPQFDITIFGDETHVNYNRILLSSVLAGERTSDEISLNTLEWYRHNAVDLRLGVRIVDVDAKRKTVTGDDGSVTPYDTLLFATGSTAFMPPIEGLGLDGVFTFRTLDDTRSLLDRAAPGVRAIVIGGGLLGLEAARGLQVRRCGVTVVIRTAAIISPARWRISGFRCCSAAARSRSSATSASKASRSRTAPFSKPISSSSPRASGRTSIWPTRPASPSTAASW